MYSERAPAVKGKARYPSLRHTELFIAGSLGFVVGFIFFVLFFHAMEHVEIFFEIHNLLL